MKLHPLMRRSRYGTVLKFVREGGRVLDVGCGKEFNYLNMIKDKVAFGYGLDKAIDNYRNDNIELIQFDFDRDEAFRFPIPNNSAIDQVFILAVIEHVNYPKEVIRSVYDCLCEGGEMVLTTPTPLSKPILEFLSYRLKLIDDVQIRDHKNYFSKYELMEMVGEAGFKNMKHAYFGMHFNQLLVGTK